MAQIEYAAPFTMEEMTAGMIETTGLDKDTVIAWMNALCPDSVSDPRGIWRRSDRAESYRSGQSAGASATCADSGISPTFIFQHLRKEQIGLRYCLL